MKPFGFHVVARQNSLFAPWTWSEDRNLADGVFAFAFLAFWDLAHRDRDEVRGPKPAWIPAILVNWIGPASYFLFGIRR